MEKTLFTAYGRATTYYGELYPELKSQPVDHVFIESATGENWRLFGGQDVVTPLTPAVGSAAINYEWFKRVHGEGSQIAGTVAGINVYVTGTCQNAANRLLALGLGDVSKAQGHPLVILAYGKYGFGVMAFIDLIRSTAQSLNGEVSQSDVDATISEIAGDQDDEFSILEQDFDKRFGLPDSEIPSAKRLALKKKYLEYHDRREKVYAETPSNPNGIAFQKDYSSRMKVLMFQYLTDCHDVLGDECWTNSLKLPSVSAALARLTGGA